MNKVNIDGLIELENILKEKDKQIQQLTNRITELEQINEEHQKINGELMEENKRLKEHLKAYKKDSDETQDRIDKAIKIIKDEIEHCDSALTNPEYTIVSKHDLLKQEKECCIKQLNILEGSDKE